MISTSKMKSSDALACDSVGDPTAMAVMGPEQTCNFENFWKSLFCFGGPPLPDAELPRDFVDFPTSNTPRINSFTRLQGSQYDLNDVALTEVSGIDSSHARKKTAAEIQELEDIEQNKVKLEELKTILNHNTEMKLKEVVDSEELLALRQQSEQEEQLRLLRKQQFEEQKKLQHQQQQEAVESGFRPRAYSASLPPPSPRNIPPSPPRSIPPSPRSRASSLAGTPVHSTATSTITNGDGVASHSSHPRSTLHGMAISDLDLDLHVQTDDRPPLGISSTLSRSNSSRKTPRALILSPYRQCINHEHFLQISTHTTGDDISDVDLSNFSKFACSSEGVHCLFYLPAREGDAKPKTARFLCNTDSTSFRLDILGPPKSPSSISPSPKSGDVIIKTLTFDAVSDILAVSKGKGPVVLMPADLPQELALHIVLLNKPEINLSFSDTATRDVVYNALPKLLGQMAHSPTRLKATPTHNYVIPTLMGLSQTVLKLTSIYWVETPSKSIYSSKFSAKLLITRNDDTLQLFSIPKDMETHSSASTPTAAASANKARDVDNKRRGLFDQLTMFMQSKYPTDLLPEKGFELVLELNFSEIKKVSHIGESDSDHLVEILYQKEKKDEVELEVRLDATDKRKSLIIFLEEKRKSCKKNSSRIELL